jgi:RecB family exonuclease
VAESLAVEGVEGYTPYAAEGTAAHTVAEMVASYRAGLITEAMLEAGLAAWRGQYANAPWLGEQDIHETEAEMIAHAQVYADVIERERARQHHTEMHLELKVFPEVPSVWGTGDCVIIGADEVAIIDYKYGTGVRVDAPDNEQLMLYALGAVEADVIGLAKLVRIIIVQPRLDHVSVWEIDLERLLKWRAEVAIPAAELAMTDDAPFGPSEEACRFCPVRGQCKAQMQWVADRDFGQDADLMDGDDYADAIAMLPAIRAWCTVVEEKALEHVYSKGESIPGWKAVLSGQKRIIPDPDAAVTKLVEAGYPRDKVERTTTTIQTLGELDKVVKVGRKKVLAEVLGELLKMSEGRPSLVPEGDPRPAITANDQAASDFTELDEDD